MFLTKVCRVHLAILSLLTAFLSLSLCAPCFSQGEHNETFVNERYGYQCELPDGLVAKDKYNSQKRIELHKNSKIAMSITAFEPNPGGSVAYNGEMRKSDELTLKERITFGLSDVCKPGLWDSEFMQSISWSFPIVGGEVAVQANSTSWEKCSFLIFPVTMVQKGNLSLRFKNYGLSKKEYDHILVSFEFLKHEDIELPNPGGE